MGPQQILQGSLAMFRQENYGILSCTRVGHIWKIPSFCSRTEWPFIIPCKCKVVLVTLDEFVGMLTRVSTTILSFDDVHEFDLFCELFGYSSSQKQKSTSLCSWEVKMSRLWPSAMCYEIESKPICWLQLLLVSIWKVHWMNSNKYFFAKF